ncbi:MAG: VOC family protein, partial [Paracoccaceae bacterium]
MTAIPGLHHVTAIAGDAQANVDFYTGILRQRLVKKTVNFDAPDTYHLYYGDAAGSPGTILTFFPFAGATPGRAGPGMAQAYAYAVPKAAFDGWVERAGAFSEGTAVTERFGARVLTLRDPDGAPVELIEGPEDGAEIGGFHSVTLWERDIAPTARLLTEVFGYVEAGHEVAGGFERLRLTAPGDAVARHVDLVR